MPLKREDWSNETEKSALITSINYIHIKNRYLKIVIIFHNIPLIFFVLLVSIRYFFQNISSTSNV